MFSGHGLYSKSKFFGIIADGSVYFRTGEATRPKFVAPGSGPFMPSARQKLKNYYAVPVDVLEDSRELTEWARKALCVELEK